MRNMIVDVNVLLLRGKQKKMEMRMEAGCFGVCWLIQEKLSVILWLAAKGAARGAAA